MKPHQCSYHSDFKQRSLLDNDTTWKNCSAGNGNDTANSIGNPSDQVAAQLGKPTLMLMAIFIALMGNFFIIFTYSKNFKMRTITNTLVVNLCAADLLSSAFDFPFWLSIALGAPIYRQLTVCRVLLCFEDLFHIIAILTMCGIAMDRFVTLVKGQRRLMTYRRARMLILWSWIQATISSAPWNLIRNLPPRRCETFPHIFDPSTQIRTFDIFFKTVNIVIPFLGSYIVFYHIVQAVRGRSKVKIDNNYVSRNYSAERFAVDAYKRSSKTAIILFLMFLICTLPYLCVILWNIFTSQRVSFQLGFIVYFVFTMKRSLFPAIYIFRNRVIWSYIQETLSCVVCRAAESSRQQDTLSCMAANQTVSCFTIFGRNFYRTRVHPSVFDGENNYFPKNLEVRFVYNANGKEVKTTAPHFTDIAKEGAGEGDRKVIGSYSSNQ